MSSHIQTALMNQLQTQIKHHIAYETAKLYLDLRHRVEQHELINKHFIDREQNVSNYILDSYDKRRDIIKINQMRFNLRIDERMELMFNNNVVNFTNYEIDDIDLVQEKMFGKMNDFLFFKNAYTNTTTYDSDNTYFYLVLLTVIALMCKF